MKSKKYNSFSLLWKAAVNCKGEIWRASKVLLAITLILFLIFNIAEGIAQPGIYSNPIRSFVWAATQYIGDPGHFAGPGPVTLVGRIVATTIGIIKILIFAVPAGMIGGSFSDALAEEKKARKMKEDCNKIRNCFYRDKDRHTNYRCVPPYISVASLQIKLGLNVNEIIDAVNSSKNDDLRLRNLAETYSRDLEKEDKLVVELFPLKGKTQDVDSNGANYEIVQTEYGAYIDRGSKVTIVATSSYYESEIGDSHFAYYLALYGGFNYISREFGPGLGLEQNDSFYTIPVDEETKKVLLQDHPDPNFTAFKDKLEELSSKGGNAKDSWTIFILSVPRKIKSQFSFVHEIVERQKVKLGRNTTVLEEKEQDFLSMYERIKDMVENHKYPITEGEKEFDTDLKTDLDECFKNSIGRLNIGVNIGGGKTTNAFTLRVASKILARDRRNIPIAVEMARIIRETLAFEQPFNEIEMKKIWRMKGVGYGTDN